MKKIILLFVVSCWFVGMSSAQQEQQYTQFMFNKLAYNPGYAGSFSSPTLLAAYRGQWIGLEGAPRTYLLSYHQPMLNDRVGIGGNLISHSIGINKSVTVEVAYSYRIKMRKGILGIGIQASMRHFRQDWTDSRLLGTQPIINDSAIPNDIPNKIVPNFGLGAFFSEEKYYCGISLPRLVKNNIDFATTGAIVSREAQHIYAMGGIHFMVAENIKLTPQVLLKYVKNTPFSADINCNAQFKEQFTVGMTYRTGNGNVSALGESIGLLTGFQITKNLFMGVSYDVGLTKLRKYSNGSTEAVVRYWFNPSEIGAAGAVSPRNW